MSLLVAWMIAMSAPGAVIFTNLVSFTGTSGAYPGAAPFAGLVVGADGNLYGTTSAGGSNNLGTVFRLTPDGRFTSLFSFKGTNGANPKAALTPAGNGVFYGTTFAGGVSNWGTIFLITTNGAFTNLFSFAGTNHPYQGAAPASALVPDGKGNYFGTADFGGKENAVSVGGQVQGFGYGTVFEWTTNGTVTVPVVFGGTNGIHPSGGLILGQDGNFYGTTTWGGRGAGGTVPGFGTVFRLNPNGTFTNIYQFSGGNDGGFIYAGLAQGKDGYLYGAAFGGGTNGFGTVFEISTNGDFVITTNGNFIPLHTFSHFIGGAAGAPYAGLMEGRDGNLYGTTYNGQSSVFRLTPGGAFTTLVLFNGNGADGSQPAGVLVPGPDNNLYGTTSSGGAYGHGTVFRLSVPMPAVFQTMALTNGTATFTWSAVAGQAYRLQYSTNLATTNWTFLGKTIVATNGVITTTDPAAAGSARRFYRMVLFP